MKNLLIIFLFISFKVSGQAPSLSFFSNAQQYQLRMYVKYEIDSLGRIVKTSDSLMTIRLNNQNNDRIALSKRVDSLSIALRKTNDTLTMVRKSMVKPSAYDFLIKDTTLIWNNENFYISNGQIVRKK